MNYKRKTRMQKNLIAKAHSYVHVVKQKDSLDPSTLHYAQEQLQRLSMIYAKRYNNSLPIKVINYCPYIGQLENTESNGK